MQSQLHHMFPNPKTARRRVAICFKNNLTAVIGMTTSVEQSFISRCDPRFQSGRAGPTISLCDDERAAETAFSHSLRMSLEHGWRVVYYGRELRG